MDWALLVIGFAIGLISGVISGAFGIGASSVKIVLLRVLLGVSGAVAIATSLPLSIPAAISGTLVYHKHKLLKYKTIITCGVTGAIFSVLGAIATQYVPDEYLMLGLGGLLLLFALLIYKRNGVRKEDKNAQRLREKAFYTILIGIMAGFASGFLGIGGGVIIVPLLARLRKLTYKQAIPCSLAIMLIYLIPASITHLALGQVDVPLFIAMLAGSAIGAWVGAKNIVKMTNKEIRKWFAITIAFFGTVLLLHELGII
ncbi:MAG: sulfite exporter TauE/SafE family protein [bacterium]|nr:sulfite exporter TauE/SafE family protein [bacterium]